MQKEKTYRVQPVIVSSLLCYRHTDSGYEKDMTPTKWKNRPRLVPVTGYWLCHSTAWQTTCKTLAGRYGIAWDCIPVVIRQVWLWERGDLSYWWWTTMHRNSRVGVGREGLNSHHHEVSPCLEKIRLIKQSKADSTQPVQCVIESHPVTAILNWSDSACISL